jgi:alkyl sulfatase BDS1-like metallo-beta-lactamase superfamily hydrolase
VRDFLVGQTTIRDVENTVEQAKREYEAKGQKRRKTLKWLNKLSLGIRHYSKALDMLAQHHPEYVGLAWGVVKFVLIVRAHCLKMRHS